jgi:hypothetical protein
MSQSTTPLVLRPVDLPDLRLRLVDFWREHGNWRALAPHVLNRVGTPAWHYQTLHDAVLWWVAPEMVDLIEASAPSLPLDTTLDPTMIPDKAGFVFFSRPIVTKSARSEEEVLVSACLWGPSIEPSQVDQGAIIAEYSYPLDPAPSVYAKLPIPCGFAGWIYGQPLRTVGENWDLIAEEDADLDPTRADGSAIGDRLTMTASDQLHIPLSPARHLERPPNVRQGRHHPRHPRRRGD